MATFFLFFMDLNSKKKYLKINSNEKKATTKSTKQLNLVTQAKTEIIFE